MGSVGGTGAVVDEGRNMVAYRSLETTIIIILIIILLIIYDNAAYLTPIIIASQNEATAKNQFNQFKFPEKNSSTYNNSSRVGQVWRLGWTGDSQDARGACSVKSAEEEGEGEREAGVLHFKHGWGAGKVRVGEGKFECVMTAGSGSWRG